MIGSGKLMRFGSAPGGSIAVDMGSHSIKMLELSGPGDRLSLVSFGAREIGGSSEASAVGALKSLSEDLKISGGQINMSVSGPSVVARVVSMPDMTDEELANAVKFEMEKSIPFDINECTFDFYVQGRGVSGKDNIDVLLVAAKKEPVFRKIKIAEEAGFTVNVMDVDGFAVANAFLKNFTAIDQARTVALLNIGASCTNLIILRAGLVYFLRDLAMGPGAMNEAVSGVSSGDPAVKGAPAGLPAEKKAASSIPEKPALAGLIEETKRSFGYYENQSGRGIDAVYVSGGGADFAGLNEAFKDAFGSPPEKWNPLLFLNMDLASVNVGEIARINSQFAVAAGLALR